MVFGRRFAQLLHGWKLCFQSSLTGNLAGTRGGCWLRPTSSAPPGTFVSCGIRSLD